MDLEQYIAGCLNFDVNEYFKRYIATTGTVTMYSKLLSHYASNDIAVNHYAYIFLNRMCTFRLVQDHPAPSRENSVHSISIPTVNSNSSSLSFHFRSHRTQKYFLHYLNPFPVNQYTNSPMELVHQRNDVTHKARTKAMRSKINFSKAHQGWGLL